MESEKNSDVESVEGCFSQTSYLCHYSEEAEHMLIRDTAAGANYSGFGQAYSANVSESKLPEESLPYLSSSLDADIEMYNKKRMKICSARADESKEEADTLGRVCDDKHCNCRVCDYCRQSHLGKDSEVEYFSAQEEDFDHENSSREFSEQRETVGIKTLKLIDPVCEVPRGGVAQKQNLFEVSEGCPASECGIGDQTCPEAALPELPGLLQQSMSLPNCNDMTCDHQEEQTEYHGIFCGSILESYSCGSKERVCPSLLACDSAESGEMKDISLTDNVVPPQTATSEEVVSEKNDRHIHSISVKQDNPLPSPRVRAPAVAMRFCQCAEHSNVYGYEESGVCTHGASCADCTAKGSETQFPVSEIITSKNPFSRVEVADKSSHGNTNCLKLEHRETMKNIASSSTVDQAIDASSDFRACFTTNRSTSAQVCLSDRAINTEITMMNKSRPVGWHRETYAGVACNTEWSCGAGSTEEMWPQFTKTLEEHSDGNVARAGRSSQIQEQQESEIELCSSNLKRSIDRPVHLGKQAVKNSASSHCQNIQNILQRAIEAELQILNAHYQMCYQHCLKIYKLALEENECFSSSVSGTREADFEAPKLQERKISVNMDNPQTVCLAAGDQPSASTSSKMYEEQHKEQDVECGIQRNDYWFEAKEDLTVADFSVISEEAKEQQEKQDTVDLREAKIMESGNECSFICVGDLSSSVSEDGLRSCFQKYQISDTLLSVDSSNCRCATLSFIDTNKAKLAVEEMNQKETKGKSVSVELVNTSSKNKYLVSQVPTNKLWCEIQPVHDGQRNYQDKTLTSASVKALAATSASEKTDLCPVTTSNISCSTQVPSETKCPGLKSSTGDSVHNLYGANQKNAGERFVRKTSAAFSVHPYDDFISPNTLNLSSFAKLMMKLKEIHPETSRDKIVDALLEVKKNNNGILSGLSISSIVDRTSAVLRKSTPSFGWEKQFK